MVSSEMPRFTRSRLKLGPNASRSLMDVLPIARTLPQPIIGPAAGNARKQLIGVCLSEQRITISSDHDAVAGER
jgi:hypothetical protein